MHVNRCAFKEMPNILFFNLKFRFPLPIHKCTKCIVIIGKAAFQEIPKVFKLAASESKGKTDNKTFLVSSKLFAFTYELHSI